MYAHIQKLQRSKYHIETSSKSKKMSNLICQEINYLSEFELSVAFVAVFWCIIVLKYLTLFQFESFNCVFVVKCQVYNSRITKFVAFLGKNNATRNVNLTKNRDKLRNSE